MSRVHRLLVGSVAGLLALGTAGPPAMAAPGAESADPVWTTTYDGSDGYTDSAGNIALDPVTGIVVRSGASNRDGDVNDYDIATVAYAADGRELWSARVGGVDTVDQDSARDIAADSTRGVVYVAGGLADGDAVVLAYAVETGVELWRSRTGQAGHSDTWLAVDVDAASGRIAVTGRTVVPGSVDDDAVTQVLEPDGTIRWTAPYTDPAGRGESNRAIAFAPDGTAVYTAGESAQLGVFGDGRVLAYDVVTGAQRWTVRLPGSGSDREVYLSAIETSSDGSVVYVTGGYARGGLTVAFAAADGGQRWLRQLRPVRGEYILFSGLAVDPVEGTVYVSGGRVQNVGRYVEYLTTLAYSPRGGRLWLSTQEQPPFGAEAARDLVLDATSRTLYVGAARTVVTAGFALVQDVVVLALGTRDGRLAQVLDYDQPRTVNDYVTGLALDPGRDRLYVAGDTSVGSGSERHLDYLTLAFTVP